MKLKLTKKLKAQIERHVGNLTEALWFDLANDSETNHATILSYAADYLREYATDYSAGHETPPPSIPEEMPRGLGLRGEVLSILYNAGVRGYVSVYQDARKNHKRIKFDGRWARSEISPAVEVLVVEKIKTTLGLPARFFDSYNHYSLRETRCLEVLKPR